MTTIKWIVKICLILMAIVFLLVSVLFVTGTQKQIRKDKRFKESFSPYISYVDRFKNEHNRFPSQSEFLQWSKKNNPSPVEVSLTVGSLPFDPDHELDISENKEYILQVWRGEWFVFYVSQNRIFYPKAWSWSSAITQSMILILLGVGFLLAGIKIRVSGAKVEKDTMSIRAGKC